MDWKNMVDTTTYRDRFEALKTQYAKIYERYNDALRYAGTGGSATLALWIVYLLEIFFKLPANVQIVTIVVAGLIATGTALYIILSKDPVGLVKELYGIVEELLALIDQIPIPDPPANLKKIVKLSREDLKTLSLPGLITYVLELFSYIEQLLESLENPAPVPMPTPAPAPAIPSWMTIAPYRGYNTAFVQVDDWESSKDYPAIPDGVHATTYLDIYATSKKIGKSWIESQAWVNLDVTDEHPEGMYRLHCISNLPAEYHNDPFADEMPAPSEPSLENEMIESADPYAWLMNYYPAKALLIEFMIAFGDVQGQIEYSVYSGPDCKEKSDLQQYVALGQLDQAVENAKKLESSDLIKQRCIVMFEMFWPGNSTRYAKDEVFVFDAKAFGEAIIARLPKKEC